MIKFVVKFVNKLVINYRENKQSLCWSEVICLGGEMDITKDILN